MSLNLYFLQHGETTHSQTGRCCDELDPELTSSGLQIAQAFANAYQSIPATIRIILYSLLGIDVGRYRDRIAMPVASVSVVKFDRHGPMLQRLGDREHLPKQLRHRART